MKAKHNKYKKAKAKGHKEAKRKATPAEPLAEPCTEPEEEIKKAKLARLHAAKLHVEPQPTAGSVEAKNPKELTDLPILPDQVKEANQNNVLLTEVREYLANSMENI